MLLTCTHKPVPMCSHMHTQKLWNTEVVPDVWCFTMQSLCNTCKQHVDGDKLQFSLSLQILAVWAHFLPRVYSSVSFCLLPSFFSLSGHLLFFESTYFTITTLNIACLSPWPSKHRWCGPPGPVLTNRYQPFIRFFCIYRGGCFCHSFQMLFSTVSPMEMLILLTLISNQGHMAAGVFPVFRSPGERHSDSCRSPVDWGAHSTWACKRLTEPPGLELNRNTSAAGVLYL